MKARRKIWLTDVAVLLLAVLCLALTAVVAIVRPVYLIPVAVILVLTLILSLLGLRKLRRGIRKAIQGPEAAKSAEESALEAISIPIVILHDKTITWYNKAFLYEIAGGDETCLLPVQKLMPALDVKLSSMPGGQNMEWREKKYTVYTSAVQADPSLLIVLFIENTLLKTQASEYFTSRPAVLYFLIDTYDEVLKPMKESERAKLISAVDTALENYVGNTTGFLRRVSNSRYLAVVEERHVARMVEKRFDILDLARKTDEEALLVSLSIGVGRHGANFKECEDMAQQALDMALGRGGDQAAVKSPEGFEFYGGVSRSVEKRTKVKSRIIAGAIRELIGQSEQVLVMGHKNSDMDSLGACVGMLRFARICKKPAAIVINPYKTQAESLLNELNKAGYAESILTVEEAKSWTGKKTLLIIVDTHMKNLLESETIYQECDKIAVIDHHRKMVGHIDNAVIFYHEPYASSASELVSELLQYVGDSKEDRPTSLEAEALLAGIMLDTRTFSLHVGVRTFEAAAYLRRMGAQTADVKKLFVTSMDDYLYRSHLVSEAKVYLGCAVVVSDQVPFECEVVAPQAANDLLTIEGVQASFVAIMEGDQTRISARSMGEVNVQLVMEKLGGGGHLTMAGAQITGLTLEEVEKELTDAIAQYREEHTTIKTLAE